MQHRQPAAVHHQYQQQQQHQQPPPPPPPRSLPPPPAHPSHQRRCSRTQPVRSCCAPPRPPPAPSNVRSPSRQSGNQTHAPPLPRRSCQHELLALEQQSDPFAGLLLLQSPVTSEATPEPVLQVQQQRLVRSSLPNCCVQQQQQQQAPHAEWQRAQQNRERDSNPKPQPHCLCLQPGSQPASARCGKSSPGGRRSEGHQV